MEEEDEGEDYSMKPGLCPFSVSQLCGLNDTRSCVADDECDGDAKCCLTSSCGSVCAEAELKEINTDDLDFDRSPSSKLKKHYDNFYFLTFIDFEIGPVSSYYGHLKF